MATNNATNQIDIYNDCTFEPDQMLELETKTDEFLELLQGRSTAEVEHVQNYVTSKCREMIHNLDRVSPY